jgi:hypothetical protein
MLLGLFRPGVALLLRSRLVRVSALTVVAFAGASGPFLCASPRQACRSVTPNLTPLSGPLPSLFQTINRNTNANMPRLRAYFPSAFAFWLVSCASPPSPLLPDHPASATAPEAPTPRPIRYLSSDADSQRTKQLLAQAARQDRQEEQNAPGQGKTKDQQNMPGMDMPGHQH